jgi:hypothetical protein
MWLAVDTSAPVRIMFDPATDGPIRIEEKPRYQMPALGTTSSGTATAVSYSAKPPKED